MRTKINQYIEISVTAKLNKMCKTGFMHIFTRVCIKSAYRMRTVK